MSLIPLFKEAEEGERRIPIGESMWQSAIKQMYEGKTQEQVMEDVLAKGGDASLIVEVLNILRF